MPQPRLRAGLATHRLARLAAVIMTAGTVALAGCTSAATAPGRSSAPAGTSTPADHSRTHVPTGPAIGARPNIVFVLTDDLSTNLLQYMPHVRALQQAGMTFTNYTVADSLCCPSRASIFTGDYPHNTQVVSNVAPAGGFEQFTRLHEDRNTFATSLSAVGYRTGFIGKYLNGYEPTRPIGYYAPMLSGAYVPPGWDVWHGVDAGGYRGYGYVMTTGHNVRYYGDSPSDYMTTVAQQKGIEFINESAAAKKPFLLEVATFAPHQPSTPAPQDVGSFTGIRAPHSPAFGRLPKNPPAWLASHAPLGPGAYYQINDGFEKRVEAVQSVDRMVGALQRTLVESGQARNTVFIFSSDNGFHLGEYTLRTGKQTAFDTDIRVPLIVSGPGIPAGSTNADMVQNIDLRPTLDQLAAADTPADVDGRSVVALLHGRKQPWRTVAVVEHTHDAYSPIDPDVQNGFDGVPPTYNAIRTTKFLYVRYISGDREYYDLTRDPYELNNLGHFLAPDRRAELDRMLHRIVTCHGSASCWAAGMPSG